MATSISSLNDFEDICRLCLKKQPYLISIFNKVLTPNIHEDFDILYNLRSYSEIIRDCTSIQISESDIFPKKVCKLCSKQIEQSYKLKIQCLSSAKKLQNLIHSLERPTLQSKSFTENTDSTKNNDIHENTIEILVKEEITDNFEVTETKLNINYTDEDHLYKIDADDENTLNSSLANEIIKEEKPDVDSETCNNDDKIYKCKDCTDEFVERIELTNHYKKLHVKLKIKCEFCDKTFLINSAYQNHLYNPKHQCKVCLKEFDCNGNFVSHLKERITCEKCGDTFQHNKNDIHICLKLQEKPCLLCPSCGKTFTEKWNFEQHLVRHRNERSYHCKICDSKFNTSTLLKAHLISHSNDIPFECEVCKKRYKYASSLRRHKVSHTNYRIPCNFCDKLWKSKDSLRKHLLVHTGERKFVCTYCSKPFGRHDNLQMHLRIHTGEKPFVCDQCGTGFSAKHVLRGHMKTHER